jgi:hydrogenase expression/formation protein HypC
MCLAIPAKVIELNDDMAKASMNGVLVKASLALLDEVKVGDYILIHTGIAIEKIDEDEAQETLQLIEEMKKGEL